MLNGKLKIWLNKELTTEEFFKIWGWGYLIGGLMPIGLLAIAWFLQ